jgi:starch synthase
MSRAGRILFAASEVFPLAKTGGLADVAHGLPRALGTLGREVKVAMPAYRGARERLPGAQAVARFQVRGQAFTVWQGRLPGAGPGVDAWLLDCPGLYDRDGDPYRDGRGEPFGDNAWRFGIFCEAVALLAIGGAGGWRPDAVHCNDWQSGLVPAWLRQQPRPPRSVFTIHNLAYQGNYGRDAFEALGLPPALWSIHGVEFHGQLSFMKAALVFADAITTVSPGYAREILTPEFGFGLEGVLAARRADLHGILNGVDTEHWDPATDPHLARRYGAADVAAGKAANKAALQAELGLAPRPDAPLVASVTRLAWQKGSDVLLGAAAGVLDAGAQLVVLGAGDRAQEADLATLAAAAPSRLAVRLGHDEALAHRILAAADLFVMPSRFEPCGLTQMFSQRYGTLPVVRRVGGLADTVTDATPAALARGAATGVVFDHADSGALLEAVRRALALWRDAGARAALQGAGMRRDFSWGPAAAAYAALYDA